GALAVTDHDTVEGLPAALEAAARAGVEVLPGCEVTGEVDGRVVHLLAYGHGLMEPGAIDRAVTVRHDRQQRNLRIGAALEALTGVGYADALELAGRSALSRAHFARALVRHGAVADVAEAFDRYLSNGRPAYVAAPSLPAAEVVALVHAVGGVVVLAHPGRLAEHEREHVVDAAIDTGVDGLEVWHPQHDQAVRRRLEVVASRHGLLATGGSDYHGRHKPGVHLGSGTDGNVLVPARAVDDLKERLAAALRR
ncbi:MAG TPA: phosphatase, partial [Actinomycetes bacterium]|nr:phosphatase [Actinomycetes bacterium]